MKKAVKKKIKMFIPDSLLEMYRERVQYKRLLRRYLYNDGKPFLKKIDTQSVNFEIMLDPQSNGAVDDVIADRGYWEPELATAIRQCLPEGGVFIDIGANIGYHSLLAASLNKNNKVIAFEPQSSLCDMLQSSIEANNIDNITILRVGVSDASGSGVLHIPRENAGGSTLIENVTLHGDMKAKEFIELVSLDECLARQERIDLIKVDAEGFEYQVFCGAKKLLSRTKPAIIFEYSPVLYNYGKTENAQLIITLLSTLGYEFYSLAGEPFNISAWLSNKNLGQIDVLAKPGCLE